MPYIYYGDYEKKAREKAGLSLERCAQGICSVQTLYRVEHNKAGISPIVFEALMSRCGQTVKFFPIFENWDDYECFCEMYKLDIWIRSWQVESAYQCIKKVEAFNFANNTLYYQKWLYDYACLLNRAVSEKHGDIHRILEKALSITKPEICIEDMTGELFTDTEIRILILMAENSVVMGEYEKADRLLSQLEVYMTERIGSREDKDILLIEIRKVKAFQFLHAGKGEEALRIIQEVRRDSFQYTGGEYYIDVTFLYGMAEYLTGNQRTGIRYMRAACYSSDAIHAQFTRKALEWLGILGLSLDEIEEALEFCPPKVSYDFPDLEKVIAEKEEEVDESKIITYGKILKRRRKEQRVSARVISQGLCTESYYSKIENDKAFPDVFLARALMQRLGLSNAPFTFFVGKKEEELFYLQSMLVGIERFQPNKMQEMLDRIEPLCKQSGNDILIQWFEIVRIWSSPQTDKKSERILEKLQSTLEGFQPENIRNYRLSKQEVSHVLAYCQALRFEGNISKAIVGFYDLLDYLKSSFIDESYNKGTITMVMGELVNMLGMQGRHEEILELQQEIHERINYTDLYHLPTIYAHIATFYAVNKNAQALKEYALYTYYLFVLTDHKFYEKFKPDMEKKSESVLDYCY